VRPQHSLANDLRVSRLYFDLRIGIPSLVSPTAREVANVLLTSAFHPKQTLA